MSITVLTHLMFSVDLFLWQDHAHPMTMPIRVRSRMADTAPRAAMMDVLMIASIAVLFVTPLAKESEPTVEYIPVLLVGVAKFSCKRISRRLFPWAVESKHL